ncbi:hypothetical protein ACFL0V_06860 [Nanoarchaeota archaeon]
MGLTPSTKEMLFILGKVLKATNRRFGKAPLDVSIFKAEFIDILKTLRIIKKQPRSIYKNLESLQKMRFVSYKGKCLSLTKKGHLAYTKMDKELQSLSKFQDKISSSKVSFRRKTQTKLKY